MCNKYVENSCKLGKVQCTINSLDFVLNLVIRLVMERSVVIMLYRLVLFASLWCLIAFVAGLEVVAAAAVAIGGYLLA